MDLPESPFKDDTFRSIGISLIVIVLTFVVAGVIYVYAPSVYQDKLDSGVKLTINLEINVGEIIGSLLVGIAAVVAAISYAFRGRFPGNPTPTTSSGSTPGSDKPGPHGEKEAPEAQSKPAGLGPQQKQGEAPAVEQSELERLEFEVESVEQPQRIRQSIKMGVGE